MFVFRISGCLPLLKNNGKARERRKSGRERAEPSYPKRTKGSFRCMLSTDRSTHPHFFIRRAGCHAGVGFPGRCQLLLHTVDVPLAGYIYIYFLRKSRTEIGIRRGLVDRTPGSPAWDPCACLALSPYVLLSGRYTDVRRCGGLLWCFCNWNACWDYSLGRGEGGGGGLF